MELIASFSVDHNALVPGIFISRQDQVGESIITTYDIRLTRPNREPGLDVSAMHSLEHILATYLRNHPDWKDEVVYWGPMGCLTGFYLIMKGNRAPQNLYGLLVEAFQSVQAIEEVPGTAPENCGNYLLHNLPMAKWYAHRFADYLIANADNPAIFSYPQTDRVTTSDDQLFFDS